MAEVVTTLYDFAKQLEVVEDPMDPISFNIALGKIADKMLKKDYWMLLCRERNDYSIFINTIGSNRKRLIKELTITLHNRGAVTSITEQPDGAFEIWVRDEKAEESFAYYLFDYTNGIIDCEV